jgi:hypothetical protein
LRRLAGGTGRCWPHGEFAIRAVALRARAHSFTTSQFHRFTGAVRTGDLPLRLRSGQAFRQPRLAPVRQSHGQSSGLVEFDMPGEPLIRRNIRWPELRSGQQACRQGRGGGGVPLFALIPKIPSLLTLRKTVLYRGYAHICCIRSNEHLPQKEAAIRMGTAALLLLRLIAVYALEGYWSARVREGLESLVMGEFHFGNEVSGLAGWLFLTARSSKTTR